MNALKVTAAVAAVGVVAVLALSGCGTGQLSQTGAEDSAVDGMRATIGAIDLRDLRLLPAAPPEHTNIKGGRAVLAFRAVNDSASAGDELASITSDLGPVTVTPLAPAAGVSAVLPPNRELVAAGPGGQHTPAVPAVVGPFLVEITNLSRDVAPGLTYPVTFNFKNSGTVSVEVPVAAGGASHPTAP